MCVCWYDRGEKSMQATRSARLCARPTATRPHIHIHGVAIATLPCVPQPMASLVCNAGRTLRTSCASGAPPLCR